MSTRLDLVLQKHPEHEAGIRLLASRDPSQNLKYLDWGVKVLASGQALAPEIADVLDLFHRFAGRPVPTRGAPRRRHVRRQRDHIRPDIYAYRPQDLASLRDNLHKVQRATDRKRRERERLYRIEGTIEADVIYDSADLVVRHIKNKEACCHYGLNTKWCIAMRRELYFDDYETQNAVFFFFERKSPIGDTFDKMALMVARTGDNEEDGFAAFTALDQRVDMLALARVYGVRVFDIFRVIYECSERHPASTMFQVYAGKATAEELAAVFATIVKGGLAPHEARLALQAICCNDAAPYSLLKEIADRGPALVAAWERRRARRRNLLRVRRHRCDHDATAELTRAVMAAMVIHPNVPEDAREKLAKQLCRRRIDVNAIRRVSHRGRIDIAFDGGYGSRRWRRRRRRHFRRYRLTVKALRARAAMYDRTAARLRKRAKTVQRKLTEAKKKKKKRAAAAARRKA